MRLLLLSYTFAFSLLCTRFLRMATVMTTSLTSWIWPTQPSAQEKFLRIKHAYNTLMNSESRSKYANSNSDSSWASSSRESKSTGAEEQFYGFGKENPSVLLLT